MGVRPVQRRELGVSVEQRGQLRPGPRPEAWTGFGALSGSWIGGTGNLFAAAEALGAPPEMSGLAVLADSAIYVVWLPLLLGSKSFAERFNRWTRVSPERLRRLEELETEAIGATSPVTVAQLLYLAAIALLATWGAVWLAGAVNLPRAAGVPWTALLPGTAVFTLSARVLSIVTSVYFADKLARADDLYGSIGLATVFLAWLFIAARVMVAATFVNASRWFAAHPSVTGDDAA